MPPPTVPSDVNWLKQQGVSEALLEALNPAVPGEFTLPDAFYINTATPSIVYRGTEEGTLPLVPGRWYVLPTSLVRAHPTLVRDAAHVASAVRRTR